VKPVVLIERTSQGAAYRYSRFENRESTHIVETPVAKVGEPLEHLSPSDVEWFRSDPKRFLQ
jgi:hypothetical protein